MSSSSLPNLFVTSSILPYDEPDTLLKILSSSLSRSLFSGTQRFFRTDRNPLFKIDRREVEETTLPPIYIDGSDTAALKVHREFLMALAEWVKASADQWIIVSDRAGIALRNIDHLIPTDSGGPHKSKEVDLYWTETTSQLMPEASAAASPGLWAVRGKHLPLVLERFKKALSQAGVIQRDSIQVWSEVVNKLPLRTRRFEKGEVYAPAPGYLDWQALESCAFLTLSGWSKQSQLKLLQALYLGTYFGDESGLILGILDS